MLCSFNLVVIFLLLNYKNSLCIVDMSLSDMCFENLFSQSVACLLSICSFVCFLIL